MVNFTDPGQISISGAKWPGFALIVHKSLKDKGSVSKMKHVMLECKKKTYYFSPILVQ